MVLMNKASTLGDHSCFTESITFIVQIYLFLKVFRNNIETMAPNRFTSAHTNDSHNKVYYL